jgi:uncharacterized protein YukE
MDKMKINPREVYKKSIKFNEIKDEFDDLLEKMNTECNNMESFWSGIDYDNFKEGYTTYLENLKSISTFLETKAGIMRISALKHGRIDNALNESVTRRDVNE